jgi:hypothetical protein
LKRIFGTVLKDSNAHGKQIFSTAMQARAQARTMKNAFRKTGIGMAAVICLLLSAAPSSEAKTMALPIHISYPMLRSLFVSELLTEPGPALVLIDKTDPCRRIRLSNPSFSKADSRIRLDLAVEMEGGTAVGSTCLLPIQWAGFIRAYARPRIDREKWQLRFEWLDSRLLDADRRPAVIMDRLWQVFEGPVFSRLNGMAIDLRPPLEELAPFLADMAAPEDRPRIRDFIESLAPEEMTATTAGVSGKISGDLKLPGAPAKPTRPRPLAPDEMTAFIRTWETWDAFLVKALLSLSEKPVKESERRILFDVLLETRYRFVDELGQSRHGPDFVRQQFMRAWDRLAPVFRAHLGKSPSDAPMSYLAFFTAADALAALDEVGPALNIEISREGLIRLARLIAQDGPARLKHLPAVNPSLRRLLGMGAPLEAAGPAFDKEEFNLEPTGSESRLRLGRLLAEAKHLFLPAPCRASSPRPLPGIRELRKWLVSRENLDPYMKKVRALLQGAVRESLRQGRVPQEHRQLFRDLVFATAWQESCFRQFVVKNRKLTFIRSYNNSSVGMMQVNERVWRGIYDLQHLRWDVDYNVRAGVEILDRYLTRYALARAEAATALSAAELAGCVYAMYNGGPSQFRKYLARLESADFYDIDRYFREKYEWVRRGKWDRLRKCLF